MKVSQNPMKISDGIETDLPFYLFCFFNHILQIPHRILINHTLGVVDEASTQQQCQYYYAFIMCLVATAETL